MNRKLTNWQFTLAMLGIFLTDLGAIFALYFYINQNPLQNQPNLGRPVTREPVSLTLNLDSLDDNLLVFDENLLASGKTSAGSILILSLNGDDQVLDISSSGNFSSTLKLQEGVNKLTVSGFDLLGNNKNENRTIFYSKEKI